MTSDRSGKDPAAEALAMAEPDLDDAHRLRVKGQMMFMSEWETIMFLGTPMMNSLDDMVNSGLYINDLSMHDSSRDLVLAGTQQSAELKLALDQEQEKSRLLGESMKKLDDEMKRTDALLYQMIPKPVADRLRRGEPSVTTCQAFDNVTILFSDVVGFTTICSRITPMEVVSMLNAMYTQFDQLSETHDVYKVETIGDAYMAVAGAPTETRFHALNMCNMSMDMLVAMTTLYDPSTQDTMKIRVGIHSGATVAGVVGMKMPRYCLFGDTVNTASRMETNGEAMKIHISETTRQELRNYPYSVQERGEIEVKGKGMMKTYWLVGREGDPNKQLSCPFAQLMEMEKQQHAQDRASVTQVAHRPVYSPVSFEDLNSDNAQGRLSPGLSPKPSPARMRPGENVRRGSQASNSHLAVDDRAPGGHPPMSDHSGLSAATSASGPTFKPMRAVPPTLTGSGTQSTVSEKSMMMESGVKSPPPQYGQGRGLPHSQGNGMRQQQQQQQYHHPNPAPQKSAAFMHGNTTHNSLTNNNHKATTGEKDQAFSRKEDPLARPHQPFSSDRDGCTSSSGGDHTLGKSSSGVKSPTDNDDLLITQPGQVKESRTEKVKSKTCTVL